MAGLRPICDHCAAVHHIRRPFVGLIEVDGYVVMADLSGFVIGRCGAWLARMSSVRMQRHVLPSVAECSLYVLAVACGTICRDPVR